MPPFWTHGWLMLRAHVGGPAMVYVLVCVTWSKVYPSGGATAASCQLTAGFGLVGSTPGCSLGSGSLRGSLSAVYSCPSTATVCDTGTYNSESGALMAPHWPLRKEIHSPSRSSPMPKT